MVKRMLLSALLCVATIATAQVNLNLDITVKHIDTEDRHIETQVLVDEEVPAVIEFSNELVVSLLTQVEEELATIRTEFFQKLEDDELLPATTEALVVTVPLGEEGTITLNNEDESGSLVLVITPTLAE